MAEGSQVRLKGTQPRANQCIFTPVMNNHVAHMLSHMAGDKQMT